MGRIDYTGSSERFSRLGSFDLKLTTSSSKIVVQNCEVSLNPQSMWIPVPCTDCTDSLWNGEVIAITNWAESTTSDYFPFAKTISGDLVDGDGSTAVVTGNYYGLNEKEFIKPVFKHMSTSGLCNSYFLQKRQDFWARYSNQDPILVGSRTQIGDLIESEYIGSVPPFSPSPTTPPDGYNSSSLVTVGWHLNITGGFITLRCESDPSRSNGFYVPSPRYYWLGSVSVDGGDPIYQSLLANTPPGSEIVGGPDVGPSYFSQVWSGQVSCYRLENALPIELTYNAGESTGFKLGLPDVMNISFAVPA